LMRILNQDPLAAAVVEAIRAGDTATLERLLNDSPGLANARVVQECKSRGGTESRTLLHIAADWPGHFPNGAHTVAILAAHGADLNPPFEGFHAETPLHWAASSDDVSVLEALLDAGANIEAPGSIFANGTAVADAVAFGQWNAARRLVARGARTNLWQSAGLGLLDRVKAYFAAEPPPAQDITQAFWLACHGVPPCPRRGLELGRL
jgi:uncharacterized protein